jgi:hypothetical protein
MSQATKSFAVASIAARDPDHRSSIVRRRARDHRLRPTDIAMQRPSQKSLKQNRDGEDFFSNGFDPTAPRIVRFSPAMDVLPFSGLHTSPDPLRLSNLQNNNRRGRQAA